MPQVKRYTKHFKKEAHRLVSQEGAGLAQGAQDLGLDVSMLRGWRKEANLGNPKAFGSQGFARDKDLAQ